MTSRLLLTMKAEAKRLSMLFCLIGALSSVSWANPQKIPYTKNDSAQIAHNDSLFEHLYSKGELKEASRQLDKNATLFWEHYDLDRAVKYFKRSLEINHQLGNINGIAGINSNLAFVYADLGEYETAYNYFEKTLSVRRTEGKPVGIISALVNESVVLNQLKRYETSIEKLQEALRLARESNDEVQMRSVFGMLSETYQKSGDIEKALYYYNYFRTFNDYVTRKTIEDAQLALERQQLIEQNLRLENRNKELELAQQQSKITSQEGNISRLTKEQLQLVDSLVEKESKNRQLQLKNERQQLQYRLLASEKSRTRFALGLAVVIIALIVTLLLWLLHILRQRNRRNAILKKKNATIAEQANKISEQYALLQTSSKALESKNKEIIASIEYSKNVQDAVLNQSKPLTGIVASSFEIERPFSIVSGDFHYVRALPDGGTIIAVGDCTGHGVPGAFLTILAVSILDHAIYDLKAHTCQSILETLDKSFSEVNEQRSVESHSLDVAVCILNKEKTEIEFAGAQNGLLVVKDGKTEYIRGALTTIGHQDSNPSIITFPYKNTKIAVEPGQWFYMFSDGIADQFNEKGEKFSTRRLRELLATGAKLSAQEQKRLLNEAIDQWQQQAEQIDDIMLLGFCVKEK